MKGARSSLTTLLFSDQPLLLVFAVTPQKQQQQNVPWIKSRIRKMKGGKYAQILTKIQIVAFFDMRDIRRNYLDKCTGLCRRCWCPWGLAPTWRPETNRNICYWVLLRKSRLQNSPYFCVFKYARAVKRGWKQRARLGRDASHARRLARFARVRLLRHALPISLLILRKNPTVLQSNERAISSNSVSNTVTLQTVKSPPKNYSLTYITAVSATT